MNLSTGGSKKDSRVIQKLGLKPGDIVADIGSGAGTFSIPMAKAIAPNGILYAVDIDQKMLDYVADRAKKEGVTNLRTVLGEYDDPKLPVKDVDVAFFPPRAAHDRTPASVSGRDREVPQAGRPHRDHRQKSGAVSE